jgi:hypothetical protein
MGSPKYCQFWRCFLEDYHLWTIIWRRCGRLVDLRLPRQPSDQWNRFRVWQCFQLPAEYSRAADEELVQCFRNPWLRFVWSYVGLCPSKGLERCSRCGCETPCLTRRKSSPIDARFLPDCGQCHCVQRICFVARAGKVRQNRKSIGV